MTPAFKVTANDKDITTALARRLISISVNQEINQASGAARGTSHTCDIELDDRDAGIKFPNTGALLDVSIGYKETGIIRKGTFRVDELEVEGPERRLLIRARAADTNAPAAMPQLMAAKRRSWDQTTIGAIASQVASENGWAVSIDADIASFPIDHLDQVESNASLLQQLAELPADAYCSFAGGKIVMAHIGSGRTATGKILPRITIPVANALSWHAVFTVRTKHNKVTATFHNLKTGKLESVTASAPASNSEDGEEEDSETTLPFPYSNQPSAAGAANAKLAVLQRGSETVSLTIIGNPQVAAGGQVVLSGFRAGVDRTWIVAKAEHKIDESGYTTEIEGIKL
ncbi:MAG: contractile injection system protein, VgrG/Pvc8 family [Terracidiphilus sp.]|nr:contractile injection system protein, VgrG/Pvc8 family [Terracidiphilus sp.]